MRYRGGLVELAFTTFGQFFPDQKPFAGSRRRSHELANALGQTFNDHWERLPVEDKNKTSLQASEWIVLQRLNAETGRNFTSWAEYYGPRSFHHDNFSLTEQYDLANEVFDAVNFDGWVPTHYTGGDGSKKRPWDPKNVVVLTDGTCGSTCAVFTEMLAQVGVRVIVAGGHPDPGPMQATAGTRGAVPYSASTLDKDFEQARKWSIRAGAVLPQVREPGLFVQWATFNLRDQVREADDTGTPLQFQYIPADCRLYYTLDNVFSMSALWRDVGHAAWVDSSLCVAGSMTASYSNSTIPRPPDSSKARIVLPDLGLHNTRISGDMPDPLTNGEEFQPRGFPTSLTMCNPDGLAECGPNIGCNSWDITCGTQIKPISICQHFCSNHKGCPRPSIEHCVLGPPKEYARGPTRKGRMPPIIVQNGVCIPRDNRLEFCQAPPEDFNTW